MQKDQLIEQARQLVQEFAEAKGWSRSRLAKKLGVSAALLSHLDNSPELVSEEMLLRIIAGLKPQPAFKLVATSNYNTVQRICKAAQERHQLTGVIGYTGAGKTTALRQYYRSTSNVYYVECKNIQNRKQFFTEVLTEMGIQYSGTVYDMVKAIIDELNTKESPLLIIDEAGKMSANLVLDLHDMRNATMENAGIILAGCEYLQTNMKRAADRQRQGFPEFYSRVLNWNVLGLPSRAEVDAICRSNGLEDGNRIKELQRVKNYRELYNAIQNETIE